MNPSTHIYAAVTRFTSILFVLLCIVPAAYSQLDSSQTNRSAWTIGLHAANAIRPGLVAGYEHRIGERKIEISAVRQGDSITFNRTVHWMFVGNMAADWLPHTSTTLHFTTALERRKAGRRRVQRIIGFGGGVSQSLLRNVYAVDNGVVKEKWLSGNTYAQLYQYVGIGTFNPAWKYLRNWSIRIGLHTLFPYNGVLMFQPTSELRFAFGKRNKS